MVTRRSTSVLEFVLYAPVGLAIAARELLPTLTEKGKAEVAKQAKMAEVIGRVATKQGGRELARLFATRYAPAAPPSGPGSAAEAAPRAPAPSEPAATADSVAPAQPAPTNSVSARPVGGADLAIADYDTLSASQVVVRLQGLSTSELEAIGVHEAAGRVRRTILNRVDQLTGGAEPALP